MVLLDVVHYVSVSHPFRNSDKFSFFHVPVNSRKLQDVRVGRSAPEYGFFAKVLEQNRSVHMLAIRGRGIQTYFSYLLEVIGRRNPQGFDRNEVPHVPSDPDICEPSARENFALNFDLFRYVH